MPTKRYGEGSIYRDAKRDLWVGQVLVGQQRRRVTARLKADMLTKMRALQAEKDAGILLTRGGTGAWLDYWLSQVSRRVSPSTHADYTRWTRLYITPYVGPIELRKLCEEDVEAMMGALEDQGLSPKTVRLARSLLIQALDLALRRDKVRKNVAKLTLAPKQDEVKISDRLDEDQVKVILKTLLYDRLYPLALLSLSTGMRPAEVFALRWNDINLRQAVLHVRKAKTPAGVRDIPLPATVVKALQEHKRETAPRRDGLVFTDSTGAALKHRDVTDWWHEALHRAGISRRRFYCTRHTYATLALNNEVPLEVVSKILGHASQAITADIYAEVGGKMKQDAAQKIEEILSLS